jgi:phage terminase large subunit GpA-like protein
MKHELGEPLAVEEILLGAWRDALTPERRLLASEWSEENIVLVEQDSAEPGPLRLSRTPYLREPLDNLSQSSPVQKTSVKKGRQLGFTTCGSAFMGYAIDHAPGPFLYATATLELARKTSKQRLARLIEASEPLRRKVATRRSKDGSNTLLFKEFPGGVLALVGANSASSLRSMPARYGFADEVDGWPVEIEGEGDPLELFLGRFDTFGRKKKILVCSTPTNEGTSRIQSEFLRGDQREYRVPCPRCGTYQPIRFSWLRADGGERFKSTDPPRSVVLLCEFCEHLIPEHAKAEILEHGEWVPTAEPEERFHRSYWLPSWYSPLGWYSWTQGVRLFLEAKRRNDEEKLKVFTNQIDADTWKERETKLDELVLFKRRERYRAEVPADALLVTCGLDIQDDRIEATAYAWGEGFEAWAIENRVFWSREGAGPGDYPGPLWDAVDDWLLGSWTHESGTQLYAAAVGVDTGGHFTQETYSFVRERAVRDVYAMKGRGGAGIPDVSAPSKKRSGDNDSGVELFTVGTDAMKDKLFARLAMKSPGPGFVHFPDSDDFDEEFFASLTGEKKVVRYRKGFRVTEWVKFRRNDVLDCYVYAYAAALILSPDWRSLRSQLEVETRPEVPSQPQQRARPVRRGWVTDWRRGS